MTDAAAKPLVRVVMIIWNTARFVEEAVQSVIAQSFENWELVIVDDGSTDGSAELAQRLAATDSRISYLQHPGHRNRGISTSRNLGAAGAQAPFLAFIDSDDVWRESKLADQLAILNGGEDLALVLGSFEYWYSWDPASRRDDAVVITGNVRDRRLSPPEAILTLYPLGPEPGGGVDLMIRRPVFEALGGFEPAFPGMYEDQVLLAKVFLDHPVFISARPWVLYRQHQGSMSARTSFGSVDHLRARAAFLRWLEHYLKQRDKPEALVWAALERTKRMLRWKMAVSIIRDRARAVRRWLGLRRKTA